MTQWIVLWDFPAGRSGSLSTFYRRLKVLLADRGGEQCRATRSAYIISGEDARAVAYALGKLAEHFGAGRVGEEGGVVVLPLGEISPKEHLAEVAMAEKVVDALTADRRRKSSRTIRGRVGQ